MTRRIDPLNKRVGHRRGMRGQALVEFALALPIVFLIIFGLIDMGLFVYGHSTLSQAAREGARVGAVEAYWVGAGVPLSPGYNPSCNTAGGPVCPADLAALRADVLAATNRMLTPFGPIVTADLYTRCDTASVPPPTTNWTDQTCVSRSTGSLISVHVVLRFTPITPVIGAMFTGITQRAYATMVIN